MSADRFDFDRPIDRRGTASLKWDRYGDRDVIPLWVADMDFAAPPAVVEALCERARHGVFGYTNPADDLDEAVVEHLWQRFGWRIEPGWITWMPGVVPAVNVVCRAFSEPGDAILVPSPVYPPLLQAPGHVGAQALRVPLKAGESGWRLDPDALEAAWTPRARLLLLCNPHNPVGRVFDREELDWLADWAERRDLVICSDEIHADLVLEPALRHRPLASLGGAIAERTITLMAPSKTFNIAGLAASFAVIGNDALRRRVQAAGAGFLQRPNLLGLTAARAAYRHGQDWLAALLDYLRGNRDRVDAAIRRMPGLRTWPVEATHLTWIDATALEAPARRFEAAGVGLSDGAEFGAPGFLRLNFACPAARLEQALARMSEALQPSRAGAR